jgi:hypothetical protein
MQQFQTAAGEVLGAAAAISIQENVGAIDEHCHCCLDVAHFFRVQ